MKVDTKLHPTHSWENQSRQAHPHSLPWGTLYPDPLNPWEQQSPKMYVYAAQRLIPP